MRASTPWLKSTRRLTGGEPGLLNSSAALEPEIPNLGDHLLVSGTGDDVVVHQDEVLLGTKLLVYADDEASDRRHLALGALQLRDAAE